MKKLSLLFLILAAMSSVAFAQSKEKAKAYLFDEFNTSSQAEIASRTQKLREKLIENVRLDNYVSVYLVFYYNENQKSPINIEKLVRDVLYENCLDCYGFDGPRITFVNFGKTQEQKTQVWFIPAGADLPDILKEEIPNLPPKAKKIDDFGKVSDRYFGSTIAEFLAILVKDSKLKGIIINYTGTTKDQDDSHASMETKTGNHLGVKELILEDRITFLRGESKEYQQTQFWIVPPGAEPPTP